MSESSYIPPSRKGSEIHQRGQDKVSRIPVKVKPAKKVLKKPDWIRVKLEANPRVNGVRKLLRENNLHTVCEEANCPNLGECFGHGTATFMIMGDICTRRCPFCDVSHGKPKALDTKEPQKLAEAIRTMNLSYVVITSVDRDDLRDGGAAHFTECVEKAKALNPDLQVEVLVPDFRGRMQVAIEAMGKCLPEVFNHNLETVPRLYKEARPGADYQWSLDLIKNYKAQYPQVKTKSGLMVGLGETLDEIKEVIDDLHTHQCDMLTIGQYLAPTNHHLPVKSYVTPEEFKQLEEYAYQVGFSHVASGPLVRSSYHADLQASAIL